MLKIKIYLRVKLLVAALFLTSGSVLAKDLDFSTSQPCNSNEQEYEINYDNAGNLEWIVEGGEIVKLGNGNDPGQLCDQFMGTQYYENGTNNKPVINWLFTTNYTRIKFYGSSKIEATFFNPYMNQQINAVSPEENKTPNFNNPLKKITIRWYQNYFGQRKITCIGSSLNFFGTESGTKEKIITFPSSIPNFSLTTTNTNPLCNEGVQISGASGGGTSYNWSTSGGVIQNNWNNGIYITRFTRDGSVPISVTVSNQCYSVTKTITLNVTQPDFGHVTQNGNNVDVPGSLVSLDCQGNFNLGMPWVSNNAIYTWELPGTNYDSQTNTYTKTILSGVNKLNVNGQLPTGGLTDFVGKVTITGVCGAPVVKTFIIRPTLRPTVDADIYSCSNSVVINVNNPTANGNINAWVAPTYPTVGYGTFINPTPTSIQFTASNPGAYVINIAVNGAGGCYTQLQTTVHAVSAGGNTTAGTAGWQSGVLSDNRKAPGSNLVAYGGNIYFSGRDGKIYFYSYSTALQKWVINQIAAINNAAIPVAGMFTNLGLVAIGTDNYLLYTDNAGLIKKINLATNIVDNAFGVQILSSEFIASGTDLYAIEKVTNKLYSITGQTPFNLNSANLKAIIPGYGVMYIQNNNLFSTWYGQLTYTGDVYASSDVVYYNGWLYFARGQKGSANLYRVPMPNPNQVEQITTTTNLSGIFNINSSSGVIYYGVFASQNTIGTVASGVYKFANIYQAHFSGTTWIFNAATQVKSPEGFDMYIQSPIYFGNHLYYIGAGHNGVIGNGLELEVWNLYYENACAPVLQRVAVEDTETAQEVLVYPNPFNTELSIDLSAYTEDGNVSSVAIEAIDATGKSIYKSTVLSELTVISTADWTHGVYVVKINHNNTVINKKVIKY